jgi:CRISPR-associated protein Cas2
MRNLTLIIYDISDDGRLRVVYDICRAFGEHLQYSVFCAKLSPVAHVELVSELSDAIHHTEDRILLIRLGPDSRDTHSRFQTLGRQVLPIFDKPSIF